MSCKHDRFVSVIERSRAFLFEEPNEGGTTSTQRKDVLIGDSFALFCILKSIEPLANRGLYGDNVEEEV